jgi:hypothetical protein
VLLIWWQGSAVTSSGQIAAETRVQQCGGSVESGDQVTYSTRLRNQTVVHGGGSPPKAFFGLALPGRDVCLFDLSGCSVSDPDAEIIAASQSCAVLSLRNADAQPSAVLQLLNMPSLEVVDLRGIPVDDQVLDALVELRNLRVVILAESDIHSGTRDRIEGGQLSRCSVLLE